MKVIITIALCSILLGNDLGATSLAEQPSLKEQVKRINQLQNNILKSGSTKQDLDALFERYSDGFTYVHEGQGGVYTRKHLYLNYLKYLNQGRYNLEVDRYTIVQMIAGKNAVAVLRQQNIPGKPAQHLTVFEFVNNKVSRIKEYW